MKVARAFGASMALVLLLSSPGGVAAADVTSIAIVDVPRPQPRWGYAPGTGRIQPGTWVTWSNDGQDAHTVTALDGSFDSGNLDPSQGFSWFFDQPGTFQYECTLHTWMTGKIVVGDGVAVVPTPVPDDGALENASSGALP